MSVQYPICDGHNKEIYTYFRHAEIYTYFRHAYNYKNTICISYVVFWGLSFQGSIIMPCNILSFSGFYYFGMPV